MKKNFYLVLYFFVLNLPAIVNAADNTSITADTANAVKKVTISENVAKVALSQNTTEVTNTNIPRTFKYQAVARDASNQIMANKTVNLKISIVADSENGNTVYSETHLVTTNPQGIINLEIGAGNAVLGSFSNISWGIAAYYVKIEMDAKGGEEFKELGTSKLLAVPYALYAETSGSNGTTSHLKSGSVSQWTTLDANSIQADYPKVGIGTGGTIPASALDIRTTTYDPYPTAVSTQIHAGGIELTRSSVPFIDFHYPGGSFDYEARIAYTQSGDYLKVSGATFYTEANTWIGGQAGIGTTTINSSAQLDVTSTTKGFLPPRMTTAQRNAIASPAAGLTIYNNETNCLNFYTPNGWYEMCGQLPGQSIHPCSGITNFTYGGKVYQTVEIGTQCWMKENLNIGTMISNLNTPTNNGIIEKYCYDNLTSNCNIYGGLYYWNEAMSYTTIEGSQGICPTGWHIPSNQEWVTMVNFLSLDRGVASNKLREVGTSHWASPNTGATNESGFTGLPAGALGYDLFAEITMQASFRTSTICPSVANASLGWFLNETNLTNLEVNGIVNCIPNSEGYSVRCVKN